MGLKFTQEIYRKIFSEVIQEIKDDPILCQKLGQQDIANLESEWRNNLYQSGIFNANSVEGGMRHNQGVFSHPGYPQNRMIMPPIRF